MDKDLLAEIIVFYEMYKENSKCIQELGCVEKRMWDLLERVAREVLAKGVESHMAEREIT